jgi:hypothetical protein
MRLRGCGRCVAQASLGTEFPFRRFRGNLDAKSPMQNTHWSSATGTGGIPPLRLAPSFYAATTTWLLRVWRCAACYPSHILSQLRAFRSVAPRKSRVGNVNFHVVPRSSDLRSSDPSTCFASRLTSLSPCRSLTATPSKPIPSSLTVSVALPFGCDPDSDTEIVPLRSFEKAWP